jgi:hypothetical protein
VGLPIYSSCVRLPVGAVDCGFCRIRRPVVFFPRDVCADGNGGRDLGGCAAPRRYQVRNILPVLCAWIASAALVLWFSVRPGLMNANLAGLMDTRSFQFMTPRHLWLGSRCSSECRFDVQLGAPRATDDDLHHWLRRARSSCTAAYSRSFWLLRLSSASWRLFSKGMPGCPASYSFRAASASADYTRMRASTQRRRTVPAHDHRYEAA